MVLAQYRPPVLAAAGPGRPGRGRNVLPGGSASRGRPGSVWSPRCRASDPRCTWIPPSPCRPRNRSRPCPGRLARPLDQRPAGSPSGWRSAPSRSGAGHQVTYHLMTQTGMAQAPWPVTPVFPACRSWAWGPRWRTMLRADAEAMDAQNSRTGAPAVVRSLFWSSEDQDRPGRRRPADRDRSARRDQDLPEPGLQDGPGIIGSSPRPAQPQLERARHRRPKACRSGKRIATSVA